MHSFLTAAASLVLAAPSDNEYDLEHDPHHYKRDAETQTGLGIFITVLSFPVLAGTFWAETTRQTVVNVGAGVVLLVIGLVVLAWGRRTAGRAARQ